LSSAILYLAIIAIWAGVLIPRWLKRDTSQTRSSKSPHELTGNEPADVTMAEADTVMDTEGDDIPAERDDIPEYAPADEKIPVASHEPEPGTRVRMLSARRRMLMMLITLAVAALGIATVSLAAWWVTIPPILMLSGYVMLLREAHRVDAEHAMLTAAAHQDALAHREQQRRRAAREAARLRAAEQRREAEEQQTARIIDISDRVRDELYDQYADAEQRAVGD
jgi:hypothetical protein